MDRTLTFFTRWRCRNGRVTLEKVYVVLGGKLTITTVNGEVELGYMDSCCIPGGENRSVKNMGNSVASMLVIMPYPPKVTS